jgi:hypothetical protein
MLGPRLLHRLLQLFTGFSLLLNLGYAAAQTPQSQMPRNGTNGKPPYNVAFIIVDQMTYRLLAAPDYVLPATDAIASHGVRFLNHYIASAMCSPSRATLLTGRSPQFHHVIDQMQYSFVPTLNPNIPNVGSVLKQLGYRTAYFGKFEMDKGILEPKATARKTGGIPMPATGTHVVFCVCTTRRTPISEGRLAYACNRLWTPSPQRYARDRD